MKRRYRVPLILVATGYVFVTFQPGWVQAVPGSEDMTLFQILVEVTRSGKQLKDISDGTMAAVRVADDTRKLLDAVHGGWNELANYTDDAFLRDFKRDAFQHYPGLQVLAEGPSSAKLTYWAESHPRSPASAYEMIGAVTQDFSEEVKGRSLKGEVDLDRAYLYRYEAAGAISLAADSEQWAMQATKSAHALAELAEDPRLNPGQAQVLSAKAQALIAVENLHITRLLARRVRLDGMHGAMAWADSVRVRNTDADQGQAQARAEFLERSLRPPALMTFAPPW